MVQATVTTDSFKSTGFVQFLSFTLYNLVSLVVYLSDFLCHHVYNGLTKAHVLLYRKKG